MRNVSDVYSDNMRPKRRKKPMAEDEAAFEDKTPTVVEIPNALVRAVRELLSKHAGYLWMPVNRFA